MEKRENPGSMGGIETVRDEPRQVTEVADTGPVLGSSRVWISSALVAVLGLLASWVVALQRPLPWWELRVTSLVNGVPGPLATVLYPVMQLGTFLGVALAAIAVHALRRRVSLSVLTAAAGVTAWFAAKAVKQLVHRGRPPEFLQGIVTHGQSAGGLGFVSGHSTVAGALAVFVVAAAPARWRPAVVALAVLVGLARIVDGVHFPADVVGGWSLGVLLGLGGLALLQRGRPGSVSFTE